MLRELIDAGMLLTAVAAGVALVVRFGRDPQADEHDLSDYHEPAAAASPAADRPGLHPSRRDWPLVDRQPAAPRRRLVVERPVSQVTPPMCRRLLIEQMVPTLSDAAIRGIADEWLREIAAEQRAKAGIRPGSSADRDLVGAFPVVRAA